MKYAKQFFICLVLMHSFVQAQDLPKTREVFLELNGGIQGYQDARFFKTNFRAATMGVEVGTRLIKPGSIRGFSVHFRGGIGGSKDVENGITLYNLGAFHYQYLKLIKPKWYFGGQIDLLDMYLPRVSNLPNTTYLDVNNTLMAKLTYRNKSIKGWTFQSGFALGLLSLHRSGQTSTFIIPEKALEKDQFDLFNYSKDIASFKYFKLMPLGQLNKVSWRNEIYRKRVVFSYTWEMLNYRQSGKPVTFYSHALGVRFNIVNKIR